MLMGKTSRAVVVGAMAVGAALSNAARGALGVVNGVTIHPPARINGDGLPVHERTPRTSGKSISVAQGKRNAKKAKNRARNRRAHK